MKIMAKKENQKIGAAITQFKDDIKCEEVLLQREIKKEEAGLKWFFKSHTFRIIIALVIFLALLVGVYYLSVQQGKIYIEDAQISAPLIKLSPRQPGILDKVYVKEGDVLLANTIVAQVDDEAIKSKIAGLVISVQNTPGQYVTSQSAIVEMIDPAELRLVGKIQEDKGLNEIKVGQRVIFTVDSFGSKEYSGVVESISPAASAGDLVFSISDKRQERDFDVNVRYDVFSHPELKEGMSAKMYIYK
jgi:multidrug resistance efflux pump